MQTNDTDITSAPRESIAALAGGIIDDARKLVQLEIKLATSLLRVETERLGKAAAYLAAAMILLVPVVLLLALGAAQGIQHLTGWPLGWAQAIVGLILASLAGWLVMRAAQYRKGAE